MATLVAPVAVRVIDVDNPLEDLRLARGDSQQPHRSLLAVFRRRGDPLGAATFLPDPTGCVSRARLAEGVRRLGATPHTEEPRDRAGARASPPVSVVVPTCCNPRALECCLRSILLSDYGDFEVIVVENRPGTSDTASMLARCFGGDSRVRYVEEHRPGVSAARNAGLAHAVGEIVAFTDDDVVVDSAWLRASVDALMRGDDVACTTGLILPRELETESQLLFEQFAAFAKGFRRTTYRLPDSRTGNPLFPYTAGWIGSGASIAMRTEVVRELGGFDLALGLATPAHGGEDLDLFVRLLRAGHAVSYEPAAIVWHHHPDGLPRLRRQVYQYGVGLGAMITKQLIAGPERRALARAVPGGLRYARDPASRKNAGRPTGYPRHLRWLEWLGTSIGPVAYVLSALLVRTRGPTAAPRHRPRPPWPVLVGAAASCVAAAASVALGAPSALRVPAVLAFLCFAPGSAFLAAVRGRFEPALVVGVSTGAAAVVAQSMLWLGAWRPQAFLYGAAAACLPPLAWRLSAARRHGRGGARLGVVAKRVHRRLALAPATALHTGLICAAVLAWANALSGANLGRMRGLGLLDAMPPTYYLAVALLLVGFAIAATRPAVSPWLLGAYVLALIVVIYATTALLYDEPRYPWTYKHLGVINLIAATGRVNRDIDIYNNWPAFFAANAWLSRTSGLAPIAYAGWAQLFFNLWGAFAVRFALRALTRDERLLWTATLTFVLGNWLGEDYLAPQSFGFVLSLVVLGLCLRRGPVPIKERSRLPVRLRQLKAARLPPADDYEPAPWPLASKAALVAGGVCFLAVVTSHQLSPVLLIVSVGALAVFTRRVPLWVAAVMAAIEVWWLVLAWSFIQAHFNLIHPGAAGAAPPGRNLSAGLPGAALSFYSPAAVMALIGALALIGMTSRVRTRKWDSVPACLIGAPLLTAGLQNYGGEGAYRAYLFALPWLAFFAACACSAPWPSPVQHARVSFNRLVTAALAIGVCLLFADFGKELENRIPSDDVRAAVWYEQHAPTGSMLIHLAPDSPPSRLTARYPLVSQRDPDPLLQQPGFIGHQLGAPDVARLVNLIGQQRAKQAYVVLSRAQGYYSRLNGLLPKGSIASFARAIVRSGQFRLVYARPSAWIYQYVPAVVAQNPRRDQRRR